MRRLPQSRSADRLQAGFTLVELLVGLALFAIVLSLVPGALQLGRRAWESTANSDRSAQTLGARNFLEQRLAEAMPVFERDAGGRRKLAFAGRPDRLMLVSPAPMGPGKAGVYRFEIGPGVSPAGRSDTIVMRQMLFSPGGARSGLQERTLLEGVARFSFRYFGTLRRGDAATWQSEWARIDALPELIELSVVLSGRNAPAFQPLVVAPRLRLHER